MFFLSNNGWMNKKTKMLCLFLKKILINRSPIFSLSQISTDCFRMQRPGQKITRKTIMMHKKMKDLDRKDISSKSLLVNVMDMDDDFRWDSNVFLYRPGGRAFLTDDIDFFLNCQMLHGQSRLRLGMDLPLPPWPFILETSPQQFYLSRINLPKNVQIEAFSVYLTHMVIGLQREGEGWILKVWTHKGVAILVTWVLSHSYTEQRFSLNHKSFFATEFISWNPQLIISRLLPKIFQLWGVKNGT